MTNKEHKTCLNNSKKYLLGKVDKMDIDITVKQELVKEIKFSLEHDFTDRVYTMMTGGSKYNGKII